ncbi:helix-turn-helix domain-containing protein, partial [Proteus mirabilis]
MLNGKDLGRAIEQAINKKLSSGSVKSKTEIARHFNVKLPSIYDWIKKGSISKDKLPELWSYFSDVVGPEHWGLKEFHLPVNQWINGTRKIPARRCPEIEKVTSGV